MSFEINQRVRRRDEKSATGTVVHILSNNEVVVHWDKGDNYIVYEGVLEKLDSYTQDNNNKTMTTQINKPWIMSICHPRNSGARSYYIERILVMAPNEETALKKVAKDCGRLHRTDHRISEPVEMENDEIIRFQGGNYIKSAGEEFKGRLVSAILCEIALEEK